MNDRRDQYICAALTGVLNADGLPAEGYEKQYAKCVVEIADFALAAAGEKDDPLTRMDEVRRLKDLLAACERERDALKAETEVHYPEVCEQYEAEIERLQAANDDHEAKIAALKRRLEPLTEEEGMAALAEVVTLHGMSSVDRTIAACKVCDRIRSRRS